MVSRKDIIYQIFVRNFSKEGTFNKVIDALPRIKELGVDIIYIMPINLIGEKERKGQVGSPYAIKDYYAIAPDLGKVEDFVNLINEAHKLGMKIILDMVFNHTSPDNVLVKTHPEYYFLRNGKFANKVGDWTDIIDLDTSRDDTQEYLLDVLKYWLSLGLDGFRFDVSSIIPLSFFEKARKEFGKDIIFLGESVGPDFIEYARKQGFNVTEDDDAFPIFDILYNYNWYRKISHFYEDNHPLSRLVDSLNEDKKENVRISCLENHDTRRFLDLINNDMDKYKSLLDFMFTYNGAPFIYAGMEYGLNHRPELFEKDPLPDNLEKNEIYHLFEKLISNKKKEKEIINQTFKLLENNIIEVSTTYVDNSKIIKTYKF